MDVLAQGLRVDSGAALHGSTPGGLETSREEEFTSGLEARRGHRGDGALVENVEE